MEQPLGTSVSAHGSQRNRVAPGPAGHPILGHAAEFQRDVLQFLGHVTRQYGDVVRTRMLFLPYYVLTHPDAVKHVLQDNNRNYNRDTRNFRILKSVIGENLLTADGDFWLRQRRLTQPAFHRQRLGALGALMTGAALAHLERWTAAAEQGRPLDVREEMSHLTLTIVGQALFGIDIGAEANAFGQAVSTLVDYIAYRSKAPFALPQPIPTARNRRMQRAMHTMDEVVFRVIGERRQHHQDTGDLLSMLMFAQDEETGERMDDRQLRNEVLNFLVAGHETTALALTWAWYLLSQHPAVEDRLHAELAAQLGGRPPEVADLSRLPYTRMVIEETMRLYPPAWILLRNVAGDDEIGGYRIPAGSGVLLSPYLTHRHPDFWPDPERFNPERFAPQAVAARPRYAYFPFGGGPRQCIGRDFALLEAQLVLATVAQRYRLRLVPDQSVALEPLLTLRPRGALWMTAERAV